MYVCMHACMHACMHVCMCVYLWHVHTDCFCFKLHDLQVLVSVLAKLQGTFPQGAAQTINIQETRYWSQQRETRSIGVAGVVLWRWRLGTSWGSGEMGSFSGLRNDAMPGAFFSTFFFGGKVTPCRGWGNSTPSKNGSSWKLLSVKRRFGVFFSPKCLNNTQKVFLPTKVLNLQSGFGGQVHGFKKHIFSMESMASANNVT